MGNKSKKIKIKKKFCSWLKKCCIGYELERHKNYLKGVAENRNLII